MLAKEAKDACLDALLAIDIEMEEIDINGIHATLGQVDIEKNKEYLKKRRERVKNAISQVNHVDLRILNDLLLKQSLQHHITQQEVVKIQRNLPLAHKRFFRLN